MGEAASNCLTQVDLILRTLDHRDVVCCWSLFFPVRLSSTQAALIAIGCSNIKEREALYISRALMYR